MTQLFNTLFITESDVSLHLEGEAIRAEHSDGSMDHIPLCQLEKIIVFSNRTVTRPLMAYCAGHGIGLSFLSESGRFLFRVTGPLHGNAEIRKRQYTLSEEQQIILAKNLIEGKISGEILTIREFRYNHPEKTAVLKPSEQILKGCCDMLAFAHTRNQLRGLEGNAAHAYYEAFGRMILSEDPAYNFCGRNRRPPRDPCNAMLSFAYTLLSEDCAAALEAVGLDPFIGVLHGARTRKPALALDIMELFRSTVADRHVLRIINRNMIPHDSFQYTEEGGVCIVGEGKKAFLREWNRWKRQTVRIPEFNISAPNGLLVHLEAQRLARWFRGEDSYRGIEASKQ